MKKMLLICALFFALSETWSQKIYSLSSGEMIFSWADVKYQNDDIPVNLRFSMFFHWGQYWHVDVTNNIGLYSGFAIRNVGYITDQSNYKMKRRSYTIGVPIVLKIGAFSENFYVFGGGEYELLFHYKQKLFTDGEKRKFSEFFSDRTKRFIPSLFTGIQFPKGINIKFKYYLDNFLNDDFIGNDFGDLVNYSDYKQTQMYYISLSFNFKTSKGEKKAPDKTKAQYANLY